MATTNIVYNNFISKLFNGLVSLSQNKFKIALMTSAYTPSAEDMSTFDDLQVFEASGTGYDAGGKNLTLSGTVVSERNINIYSPGAIWRQLSITFRTLVVYREDGLLVSYYQFSADQTITAADYSVAWRSVPLISIVDPTIPGTQTVDSSLDPSSPHAIANSVVTQALRDVGVLLDGEIPEQIALQGNVVDHLDHVPDSDIEELFRSTT